MRNPLVIFAQPPCAILPNPLGNFNQPYHVPDSRKLIQKTVAPVTAQWSKTKENSHFTHHKILLSIFCVNSIIFLFAINKEYFNLIISILSITKSTICE